MTPATNPSGFDLENTASFQTGSNHLEALCALSAAGKRSPRSLYLDGDGALSWSESKTPVARPRYVSDPANPVPYRHRPIQPTYGDGSQWFNWMTEDQRFVTDRKDLAVWKLPASEERPHRHRRSDRGHLCLNHRH